MLQILEATRFVLLPTVWCIRYTEYHAGRIGPDGDFVYYDPFESTKVDEATEK